MRLSLFAALVAFAATPALGQGQVNVYNWSDYIDPVQLKDFAKLTGIPPMMTRDHLKMARKKMFYSSAKAMAELGYSPRPVRQAVEDAVAWFKAHGMLKA